MTNKTPQLMEEAKIAALAERERSQKKLVDAVLAVEGVLIEHGISWGEWGQVIQLMNNRINILVDAISFQKIHDHYESSTS